MGVLSWRVRRPRSGPMPNTTRRRQREFTAPAGVLSPLTDSRRRSQDPDDRRRAGAGSVRTAGHNGGTPRLVGKL